MKKKSFQCSRNVCVYALRIREAIDLVLLGKEGSYVPTGMLAWRRNWRTVVTARSAHAEFVVMAMNASVDWSGLHVGESAAMYN